MNNHTSSQSAHDGESQADNASDVQNNAAKQKQPEVDTSIGNQPPKPPKKRRTQAEKLETLKRRMEETENAIRDLAALQRSALSKDVKRFTWIIGKTCLLFCADSGRSEPAMNLLKMVQNRAEAKDKEWFAENMLRLLEIAETSSKDMLRLLKIAETSKKEKGGEA